MHAGLVLRGGGGIDPPRRGGGRGGHGRAGASCRDSLEIGTSRCALRLISGSPHALADPPPPPRRWLTSLGMHAGEPRWDSACRPRRGARRGSTGLWHGAGSPCQAARVRRSSLGVAVMVVLGLLVSVGGTAQLVVPGVASAQAAGEQDPAGNVEGETPPAGAPVLTDPVTGERYVEVRPADVIERGRWAVPAWLVWCLGGLATVVGGAVLTRRMTRARRGH